MKDRKTIFAVLAVAAVFMMAIAPVWSAEKPIQWKAQTLWNPQ